MIHDDNSRLENIPEHEYDEGREHPRPEQLLLQEALKRLKPKQKQVWEMYAYDGMTEEEIASKLGVTHQAVHSQLETIQSQVQKFCELNRGTYMLLKLEQRIDREDE